MSLENIIKELEGFDKKDSIIQKISDLVKSEADTKYLEGQRKANQEAKNIRSKYKGFWNNLGLDPDDDEFSGAVETLKEKLTELNDLKENGDKNDSSKIAKLTREIEQLRKKDAEKDKRTAELQIKALRKDIKQEITNALIENKANKPGTLADLLVSQVNINDPESTLDDISLPGYDGLSINEGVKKFLGDNLEFVSNPNPPGGGSNNGKQTHSQAEFNLKDPTDLIASGFSK